MSDLTIKWEKEIQKIINDLYSGKSIEEKRELLSITLERIHLNGRESGFSEAKEMVIRTITQA